jgi:chemotaxis protein histidine kinase CheA
MFALSPQQRHIKCAIYRGPGGAGDATADATNAASVAEGFADAAATSAAAASGSAATASTAATAAGAAQTAAEAAQIAAETAETNAETAETNAETAQTAAEAAQTAAEAAQTAAELAETNAETAQAAAEAAQLAAETAETNAETAETGAVAAQAAAEAARDSALAAYDNFDDRYLGAKTSDPTLDNDGNALVAGALYFNSVANEMRLYTGSAWVAAYVSGAGFLASANNLSDVASAATARQNLDLEIGVDVQAYDSNLTSFVSTFTLPTTDGTADQVLKTNGSGTLSFVTPSPGITTGKAIAMAIVFG